MVDATNAFVDAVHDAGGFEGRISRSFVPYLDDKTCENDPPKVITATTGNIAGLSSFIRKAINKIPEQDIRESHEKNYPCVLIVGPRQYLIPIFKNLQKYYPYIDFTQAEIITYSLADGYKLLMDREDSNLGWRILAGRELAPPELDPIIAATHDGTSFLSLLSQDFIKKHTSVLKILQAAEIGDTEANQIAELLGKRVQ